MNIMNLKESPVDFYFGKASFQFFVYPGPKGSEEPSVDLSVQSRRLQNQFTPLGEGVNKLIFKALLF